MQTIILLICLINLAISQNISSCPKYPDIVGNLPNFTNQQPCSYAGYAPVNNQSALYYWYFPRSDNSSQEPAPVLIFLGGGPGTASISSLFLENGPLRMTSTGNGGWNISNADIPIGQSWSYSFDVIWMDNPVGTGFSYTNNSNYSATLENVASNLWVAFQYFMKIHNETQNRSWYVTGESFAGRYVPAFTNLTLANNHLIASGHLVGIPMNVSGMIVGDGYVFGIGQRLAMVAAAQTASLLNPIQYTQINTVLANCQRQFAGADPYAYLACNHLLDYLTGVSGIDMMSLLWPANTTDNLLPGLSDYLNNPAVQQAINAQSSQYNGFSVEAYDALDGTILDNSISLIDEVVSQIPCLFYAGNFDARDGAMSQYTWYQYLQNDALEIIITNREIWYIDGNPVGMYSNSFNLTSVIINFAGHFPPVFELSVSVQMLKNFIYNLSFTNHSAYKPSSEIMCEAMHHCSGRGVCDKLGLCNCNSSRALSDCSMQILQIEQGSSYTIQPRHFLFLEIVLGDYDQFIMLEGENGLCRVLYTGTMDTPALEYTQADASLIPQPNLTANRFFYLSATGNNFGYLTFQNSDLNQSVRFTITIYTDKAGYFLADQSTINWVFGLFLLSLFMIALSFCLFFSHEKKRFDDYHASFDQQVTYT
jgi:Serine carboxypeptidase